MLVAHNHESYVIEVVATELNSSGEPIPFIIEKDTNEVDNRILVSQPINLFRGKNRAFHDDSWMGVRQCDRKLDKFPLICSHQYRPQLIFKLLP